MSIHPPLWPLETQTPYNTNPTAYSSYDYTIDDTYPYPDASNNEQQEPSQDQQHYEPYDPSYYNNEPTSPEDPAAHLNLLVLRRHNPEITDILCIATFATVYSFSFQTGEWDKTGIEGPLFVVRLAPAQTPARHASDNELDEECEQDAEDAEDAEEKERYSIIVLNRKHLDNFTVPIRDPSALDLTEEHIQILAERSDSSDALQPHIESTGSGPDPEKTVAYGMWIWNEAGKSTEGAREHVANTVVECARRAFDSRMRGEESRRRRREERLARRQQMEQERVWEEQRMIQEQQQREQRRVEEEQRRLHEQQQRTRDQLRTTDRSRVQAQQQQMQQRNHETQGYVYAFDRQRGLQSPQQHSFQGRVQPPQTQAESYGYGPVRSSGHHDAQSYGQARMNGDLESDSVPANAAPNGRQLDLLQLFGSQRGRTQSQQPQQQQQQRPPQQAQTSSASTPAAESGTTSTDDP